MRKVGNPSLKSKPEIEAGNRSLLVTTRVPGHHRPVITKQLKCQSLHCGMAAGMELILSAHRLFIAFDVRQSSAVRLAGEHEDHRAKAQITPVSVAIGGLVCRCD